MIVLALNCGSSSLKFQLFAMEPGVPRAALASLSAIIDAPTAIGGVDFILSAHCLMLYRAERRQGEWRLLSFEAIFHSNLARSIWPASWCSTPFGIR